MSARARRPWRELLQSPRRRITLLFLVAVAVGVGWYIPRMMFLADTRAEALAYTECPWRSAARVTLSPLVTAADSLPVLAHERVHAAQCDQLGPLRYRLRNLTSRGRLSLEAPAYCAGARERLRLGVPPHRVRERLVDDATAAFHDKLDAAEVLATLTAACPDILGGTFVRRGSPAGFAATARSPGAS